MGCGLKAYHESMYTYLFRKMRKKEEIEAKCVQESLDPDPGGYHMVYDDSMYEENGFFDPIEFWDSDGSTPADLEAYTLGGPSTTASDVYYGKMYEENGFFDPSEFRDDALTTAQFKSEAYAHGGASTTASSFKSYRYDNDETTFFPENSASSWRDDDGTIVFTGTAGTYSDKSSSPRGKRSRKDRPKQGGTKNVLTVDDPRKSRKSRFKEDNSSTAVSDHDVTSEAIHKGGNDANEYRSPVYSKISRSKRPAR